MSYPPPPGYGQPGYPPQGYPPQGGQGHYKKGGKGKGYKKGKSKGYKGGHGQPQQGYPPQQGGYPPQQGGYPPQQGGYPPQQGGYPPQQAAYPPQGYPAQVPVDPNNPGPHEVWLYTDSQYRGACHKIRADTPALSALGINDKISSLRAGPGVTVELYLDSQYKGKSERYTGSVGTFGSFNDKASSIRFV